MTRRNRISRGGSLLLLLLLAGCASFGNNRNAQARMPALFCHGADWALANLRDPHVQGGGARPVCAADRLRLAAQLMVGADSKNDLNRARALVDSVQNSAEVQHDPALAGLATLLDRQLGDRRRADERIDRLAGQVREQQQKIDDLNGKLSALAAVERTMAQKASKRKVMMP